MSDGLVARFAFSRNLVRLDAVVVDNVGDTGANEVAVLGIDASNQSRATIRDSQSGNLINFVEFGSLSTPMACTALPDGSGEIAVVGVESTGMVRAEIREIVDVALVRKTSFGSTFSPIEAPAVNGIAGTGRNEIAILGQSRGQLRLPVKALPTGDTVNTILVP